MKLRGSKYEARFVKLSENESINGVYIKSVTMPDREDRPQRLHYFEDETGEAFILTGAKLSSHFNNGEINKFLFDGKTIEQETVKPQTSVKITRGKDKKLKGGKTLKTFSVYE